MKTLAAILHRPTAVVGLVLVAIHVAIAASAPWVVPYGPTALVGAQLEPPSAEFLLGTDVLGRDYLSRLLMGGRIALLVAGAGVLAATAMGALLGIAAAWKGGLFDEIVMRLVDTKIAIPGILFVAMFVIGFGNSVPVLLVVIAIIYTPGLVRIVRAQAMTQIPLGYVKAARLRGEGGWSVMRRELLPNVVDLLAVEFAIRVSSAFLAISTLSFLGLGISPPTPDWGLMVSEGIRFVHDAPWLVLFPCILISTLVVGVNFAVDGVASALGLDAARGVSGG